MSAVCSGYLGADDVAVDAFACPRPANAAARFCCGFNDLKYCCDDPDSFYAYDYAYMWWLSILALVGLSFAAVILLAFLVTVCVLGYLFIATKPSRRDNNVALRAPGEGSGPAGEERASGPQGFRKYFTNRKLQSDKQPADPERLFQRCFTATLTGVRVEGPS
ncbi:protein shisa-like-2A isoform X2 [Syngnathoides biaculeatus]|uniref:protein shisa-like-2A isoform X2 n=1 Tax=Syngnathoides biaculeatus TaxID=300417 RepID=UPI002ADE38FC|nr:protein shisa-like-2A isoform X2 [Syngnathoides biaculeatus]